MESPVHLPYREGLRNWLRTATKRLCIEAKWRVYQEILVHYNEAVDAHLERFKVEMRHIRTNETTLLHPVTSPFLKPAQSPGTTLLQCVLWLRVRTS